jgi:hypothetical protein
VRQRQGSVVLDKRIKTWNFFFWENGKRRSKKIGSLSQYPTKASAWRAAKHHEAQLSGMAGRGRHGNWRAAEADEARGHQDNDERVWRRGD